MRFQPYRSQTALSFILLVMLSVALLGFMSSYVNAATEGINKSILAPDFTLKSKDAGNIRLSEQRGNIVLINFWASWCGPCREELPEMESLYQDYSDLGFEILAVNVDDHPDKANVLLDDIEVSFPVLYDTQGKVSELFNVNAMPTTVIIDRNGKQRLLHMGYRKGDELKYEEAINMLLREE
ncbi:TlpA family protein disulfide reductase [Ningiella sp. W23]|uniref:TlpA family protein disulfide reductase n=1 Tax=Ningiella sp. W23 TaxID=3023715 RepID=UPI0037571E89